jgi:uncharacterized membrane protein
MDKMKKSQASRPKEAPTANPTRAATPPNGTNPSAELTPVDPVADKKLRESVEAAIGNEIGPEEVRARITERVVRSVVAEFYRGPLPHPRHLKAFEEACPGASDRILAMAEKAQERQENRLDKAMDYEYLDRRLGLYLGFSALVAVLVAGIVTLALGHKYVGSGLMAAGIIGTIVGTFVHGRRTARDKEEEDETPTEHPPPKKGR